MPGFEYPRHFALRNWISVLAAFSLFKTGSLAVAQDGSTAKMPSSTNAVTNAPATVPGDSAAGTSVWKQMSELRLGPFNLHPRLVTGLTYDDNITFTTAHKEADTILTVQPAFQAVAGDDAALIAYRDQNSAVLGLAPGNLIVQQPEAWPGKLLMLEYSPSFQYFDKYTANNYLNQLATVNLLWPMSKAVFGFRQDYQLQKTTIIELSGQRAIVESISTALSAAYQFGEATSLESDFRRVSIAYDEPGLTGYTEFNIENWFNYGVAPDLPVSLGVLAGMDGVAKHRGQTFEQLRARARYNYTEKLAFDASAGGELRQYQDGKAATLSPVFTFAGEYRPAERMTLSLTGSRQQYASLINGYNYASTGAGLEVQQGITDRFTAAVGAGYYSLDYTPAASGLRAYTQDYYTARISLDAKIVRHLTGHVFYQFLNSRAQASAAINDDQAGVQLTLSF